MFYKFLNNISIILILLLGVSLTTIGQTSDPVLKYNVVYNDGDYSGQYLEAEKVLYSEVNFYRERHGLSALVLNETTVNYACRWGYYMMEKHVDVTNNFYQHSKFGGAEYQIPSTTSEIIHLVYFDHYPSVTEAVSALMYGINRGPDHSILGWTQSEPHNLCLTQSIAKYYGCSIFVEKKGVWFVLYGVVNMSCVY